MHKREPAEQQAIEESGLLPDDLALDIDVVEERPEPAQNRPKFRAQLIHTVLDSQQKPSRVFDISQRSQRAHNGHALDKHLIQPYEILAFFKALAGIKLLPFRQQSCQRYSAAGAIAHWQNTKCVDDEVQRLQ